MAEWIPGVSPRRAAEASSSGRLSLGIDGQSDIGRVVDALVSAPPSAVPRRRRRAFVLAALIALGEASNWAVALRFIRQAPYGQSEPLYGRDIGFYLFSLPAYVELKNWMLLAVGSSALVAGEKAFVDYSGKRIGIADPATGEIRAAEIFVGVLGASNLTLCGGDLDAATGGLDRRACADVPLFRRRAKAAGAGQSEERRDQGLVLRPRDQPHLWRDGVALLCRNPPNSAKKAKG